MESRQLSSQQRSPPSQEEKRIEKLSLTERVDACLIKCIIRKNDKYYHRHHCMNRHPIFVLADRGCKKKRFSIRWILANVHLSLLCATSREAINSNENPFGSHPQPIPLAHVDRKANVTHFSSLSVTKTSSNISSDRTISLPCWSMFSVAVHH